MVSATAPSYHALVELEKGSPGSPREQLREAARIIAVGLDSYGSEADTDGNRADVTQLTSRISVPKEEWVLRWLMKKLKASQGDGKAGHRLDKYAWILLRVLVDRIPPKPLAAILGEHKILNILEDTLRSVEGLTASGGDEASFGTGKDLPTPVSSKGGRKRKRAESAANNSLPSSGPDRSSSWVDILLAVLEAVDRYVSLLSRIPANQAAIRSQVKLVLRVDTGMAAGLLGRALSLVEEALKQLPDAAIPDTTGLQRRMLRSLLSIVAIWDVRSDSDSPGTSGNNAFTSKSLSSALRVLSRLQTVPPSADKQNIVNGLERLVVLHVVLPLREQFFSLKPAPGSNQDYAGSAHLKAISDEIETRLSSDTQGEQLPIFFDIAIRSVPRDTFRRQLNEEPWLETLFIAIAARLGCSIVADPTQDGFSEAAALLQQLLQVIVSRKLRISHPTLSKYAMRYSGLIGGTEAPTRWHLISQIIELNVDVFLPNSGYADSEALLHALLDRITAEYLRFTPLTTELSNTLKNDIVVRLLRGFSGARDLDTFVEMWKEQLAALESARSSRDDCYFYSIWEDDVLLRAYGELISTTLPIQHIKNQLEIPTAGIDVDRKALPTFSEYTKILLIDALLMSGPSQSERFVDGRLFDRIYAISCSILSPKKEAPHWRWRLWRITQNLFDRFPPSVAHLPANLVDAMVGPGIKSLQKFSEKSGSSKVNECREAYYSFQFLGFILTKADIPEGDEYLNTLMLSFSALLSGLGDSKEAGWNGETQTLASRQTVAIGCLTVLLAEPPVLAILSSDSRRLFFNTLLSSISTGSSALSSPGDTRPADDLNGQLLNIWTSFLSADWVMLVGPAVYDLVSVIATRLPKDIPMRPLLVKSLLSIPTRLMPPHLRVSISDSVQHFIIYGKRREDVELDWLALVKRLVELPKFTSSIVTEWQILWKIADSIAPAEPEKVQPLIHAFSQLHRAVVGRVAISSESHRREFLQKTVDQVWSSQYEFTSSIKYESMEYVLCCISLNWVHENRAELGDDARWQKAVTLREAACQAAVDDLQSLARQVKKRPEDLDRKLILATVCVLDIFPDLLLGNKDVRKATQKLDEYLGRSDVETQIQKRVKCQRVARIKSDSGLLTEFMACAQSFSIRCLYGVEESAFVSEVKRRVSAMSSKKLVDLLGDIEQKGFEGENAAHALILTGIAIMSVASLKSRESPEALALSSLLTTLTNALPRFNSPGPFCLAAECIDLLLRTHPKSVSQWNIDNIMAAASIATSHSGPRIACEYAGTVHARLCRLLSTVFGLYRKKVSGRFHLILPPLQRLLRCLFSRDSRAAKASPVQSELPPWFGSMEETPLRAEHASQYCRLLSSLTDPTVSAVQLQGGSQANQALSDSTKKVKSLAGQYLQYLIIEYAGTQLRGHLSPEMKAALMPGLYSVLDVMSRENMRAMNAAMDSSSRAMFKGLYDDYVRFGKWNNE